MKCLKHECEMEMVDGFPVCKTCAPPLKKGKVPVPASDVARLRKWASK